MKARSEVALARPTSWSELEAGGGAEEEEEVEEEEEEEHY